MAVLNFIAGTDLLWSSASSYAENVVPADGDTVIIPSGTTTLFDMDMSAWATGVTITNDGVIGLDTSSSGRYLRLASISGSGSIIWGSETTPVPLGSPYHSTLHLMGSFTQTGELSLFGWQQNPRAQVATQANAGTNTVTFKTDVPADVGRKLWVEPAAYGQPAESYIVQSYDQNTFTITLTTNLSRDIFVDEYVIFSVGSINFIIDSSINSNFRFNFLGTTIKANVNSSIISSYNPTNLDINLWNSCFGSTFESDVNQEIIKNSMNLNCSNLAVVSSTRTGSFVSYFYKFKANSLTVFNKNIFSTHQPQINVRTFDDIVSVGAGRAFEGLNNSLIKLKEIKKAGSALFKVSASTISAEKMVSVERINDSSNNNYVKIGFMSNVNAINYISANNVIDTNKSGLNYQLLLQGNADDQDLDTFQIAKFIDGDEIYEQHWRDGKIIKQTNTRPLGFPFAYEMSCIATTTPIHLDKEYFLAPGELLVANLQVKLSGVMTTPPKIKLLKVNAAADDMRVRAEIVPTEEIIVDGNIIDWQKYKLSVRNLSENYQKYIVRISLQSSEALCHVAI